MHEIICLHTNNNVLKILFNCYHEIMFIEKPTYNTAVIEMNDSIKIKQTDITQLDVDAVVNAANSGLNEGGGVCGAIFDAAGSIELGEACSKIGGCPTGSAVITPGFNLKARYIIHAVGPIWNGGNEGEEELLYGAYAQSLKLAIENGCKSIAFPLISSGIYGYPKEEAWKIAIRACKDFLKEEPIEITFAVLSDTSRKMGEEIISSL